MTNGLRCLACALLFIGGIAQAADFSGKVVAVLDGDTLLVLRGGKPVKVRLAGIDAPEKAQPYGVASQQSLADLVMDKQIGVVSRAVDDYGRLVATVSIGEINVNHEQVRRGMAWEYSRYRPRHVTGEASRLRERAEDGTPAPEGCAPPCRAVDNNHEALALQRDAQLAGRGLWADEAVEPAQWRKQHPAGFVPQHSPAVAPDDSACGNKRHCSEMTSCEEARHYLTKCGIETMDGDGDGVPCEALCAPQ